MKKSRFSEEQIIGILKQQESGRATAEVYCRGVPRSRHQQRHVLQLESQVWRDECFGCSAPAPTGSRKLQAAPRGGRFDFGCGGPEGCVVKKMVKPAMKKEVAGYLQGQHGRSQRKAAALVGSAPSVLRSVCKRKDDAPIKERLRELASERPRFGYRRLHVLLRREGMLIRKCSSIARRPTGFTARKSCICAPRNGGASPVVFVLCPKRPRCRIKSGRWTLCMTIWRAGARFVR